MKTNLLKSMFISLILVMGVSNAWAASTVQGGYIYFDATQSGWSVSDVQMVVGHDSYSNFYGMSNISNTSLYYLNVSGWSDATYFAFANGCSTWGGENNKYDNRKSWINGKYTAAKTNYTLNNNSYYLFYASTSSNNASITISSPAGYLGTGYSALNYTQTVQQHLSTDGGNNYSASTAALATVTVSSYKLDSKNTTTSSSGTIASGSSSTTCSAARTATVTYTVSDVKAGYTFVGWYDGTTEISTSTTYSYNATETKTITARFKENTYTVTVTNDGHGTTNLSGAQSNVGQVTGLSIVAYPATNYEFVNWTITSGSGSFGSETSASTTFKPTSAATIQANFRSTATNSLAVVAGAGIASVTGSEDPVTLGNTYPITATPKTGYTFSTWTANPAANATFGSATTANTTVTVKNGSVIVTATATENMSTLTTSNQYDAGDPGYEVPTASVNSIGYETTATITATTDDDYTLISWTLTNCTRTDGGADNATTITVRSNGDGKAATVTANYTENPCVYFVNTARWTTIKAYAWNDSGNNGWPGANMTKEPEKISGFDVYKYVMPSGENYDKLVFNQGNDDGKTGDLEWINGKYYVYSAGQWVDKNEVADLLPKPVIYFKNNPKWKEVYVYFHTGDYWSDADNGGSGSQGLASGRVCKMEKVGETDIYKYDYEASGIVPGNVIAFTEAKQTKHDHFHKTQAVYRTDYNPNMELFIPQATYETKNETKYFNKGLWMKYNSTESGYTITGSMNSWNQDDDKFTSSSHTGYHFDIELSLGGGQTYQFQVKNIKNDWYGKQNTTITATKADLELGISAGDTYNVKLTTTSAGNYIFSIDLTEGKMMVSVEYPLQVNDYRLVYVESEVSGKTPYTKFHPAQSIRYQAEGEKKDTISFYINKSNNPAILLQQCTNINGDTITWTDVAIQNINGIGGAAPVAALAPAKRAGELYIGTGSVDVTKNGVYNFTLGQTGGNATILNEETHPYTGDYYIRTNAADGGWRKYNTNPDNIMTHSQTALKHGGYDYYFCKWVLKDQSVQYVVANDYSYCVSDTLTTDSIVTNVNGILPANANVRYTWNSSTNELARAYLAGSGNIADRYLVLIGDANLKDTSGKNFNVSGLKANEVAFEDMGNWLYQLDVKANQNTLVKLTADYNKKTQYFKGSPSETEQLIKGSDDDYTLRLIYDFKTNYLVSGLVGNQTITDDLELEEVMIIRSHHEEAQTLKISGNGSVTAKKAYGVMTFNKSTLNGAGSQYERALYWVSFPFDVKLDEAFGFGNYGEHWIMEYYDGAERAEKGLWKEPTYSYWKFIEDPKGYILEAGQGYVLCLDLDLLGNNAEFWKHDNTEIALYFPSNGKDTIVINNQATVRETIVPEHECTIDRDDRKNKDSNWNIIGVPAYTKIAKMVGENIFYYQYNAAKDSFELSNTLNFNTMHAYMVQFADTINWIEQATSIAALAARKSPTSKDQYTLRLALQQEGADHDHTFIRLQEDKATAKFDMNYDLCKIINRGANIYSMIGNVEVAANVLPVEERVIPLGLDIHETGNYTFAMPDGTDGITAILIDYETGKETNLLLADYTTELREGTNNERFALRVRPNHVATEVETIIDGANGQIKKYIINGALYILNNGQLYDAQGRMVQP